jgi:membrane protein required for colicin V production
MPTSINPVDAVVILIILSSGLLALIRGFVREVLSLASLLGAGYATAKLLPMGKEIARQHIQSPLIADIAAGVSIFFAALIVLGIISYLIARLVQGTALSFVDRSLGFVFGLLRGALVVSALYLVPQWAFQNGKLPVWLSESRSRPLMEEGANWLKSFIPENAKETAQRELERARTSAEKAEEAQKSLKDLATPTTGNDGSPEKGPAYDDQARDTLDHLIEDKSKAQPQ